MSHEIDLKKIEKKSYMLFHKDGIWDLSIGLALLITAIFMYTGNPAIGAIFPAMAVILIPIIKKTIIYPRLGYVKFSEKREKKEKSNKTSLTMLFSVTSVLGVVVFLAYLGKADWQLWLKNTGLIPLGTVMAIVSAVLGILYGIKRCYFYAVLVFLTFLIGHNMLLRPAVELFVIGLILSIVGFILFIRFMGNYPKPSREEINGISG